MEDRNRMTNEGGGQTQGRKPNPGVGEKGGTPSQDRSKDDRGRQEQGGKGGARPSPSGVPNKGRRREGLDSRNQSAISGRGEYRGGRQGQGGVPNPDDVDDDKSAGSFRGTDQGTDVDETDDGPQEVAVGQNRSKNQSDKAT